MTMSIPLPVSPQAAPGGKPATVPGKGVAHAHGPNGAPGKSGAVGEEAAGVEDMFAALVAALTEQMSPATEDGAEVAAPEVPAEAATDPSLTAVVPVVPVVAPVVDALTGVTEATAATATEVTTTTDGVDQPLIAVDATDADGGVALDGEAADGDAKDHGLGAERRATPAVRATPATHTDGVKTPAQPAVPAEPAARVAGDAAAPSPRAPEATDPSVTPVTTTPAARAERPDSVARVTVPAAPVRAADAHVQVARVVRPLRLGNDGTYELALDLTPAELGRVRIDVELRGSTISMSLRADNPATRDLLQQSMGQLRSELEAAGLQAGQLDVGGRGADDHGPTGRGHGSDAAADSAEELLFVSPTATDLTDLDPSAGLDVRA